MVVKWIPEVKKVKGTARGNLVCDGPTPSAGVRGVRGCVGAQVRRCAGAQVRRKLRFSHACYPPLLVSSDGEAAYRQNVIRGIKSR